MSNPTILVEITKFEAQQIWDSLSGDAQDVLMQLRQMRWDGYLNSKAGRDELVVSGLATRYDGFQIATLAGMKVLAQTGRLKSLTCGKMTPSGKCEGHDV